MTSKEAFVWVWLPNEVTPVVAGRIETDNSNVFFNYGRSYLDRINEHPRSISLYKPELPLREGVLPLPNGLTIPGCIRDAAPDAWGRRVIINRKFGRKAAEMDTAYLDELTYLLESGSDRIGALDFQLSPTDYIPRMTDNLSLDELLASAQRVEQGKRLSPELDQALLHGTSIGGARPKALFELDGKKYIAKFSSSSDLYRVVKAEYIAMRLADIVGLNVAPVKYKSAGGRDVLFVERFDRSARNGQWSRKSMVSALTMLGLDELHARYASYEDLAEIIRHRFTNPKSTLKELFCRMVFNVLCGNTDDHARNHAAFWNGEELSLTPAYDICPQGRSGNEASQAMLIHNDENLSQLSTCLKASKHFFITPEEADSIFTYQIDTIGQYWDEICDEVNLSQVDKNILWRRQFLNPFSVERK